MVFRNIGAVTVLSEPETVLDYRTGEIVRMLSDRRAVLLPEGETNLIEIEARASNGWLKKNQLVGLWGNSIRRPQGDVFTVKSFRHLGNSKRQLPLSSNPAVEYVPRSKDQHLQLITIVGDVIGGSEQPFATGTVMLSQSLDESPVQVFLPGPTSLLANAERVEVTGFLDLAGKNPSLYPSGFDQIKVLAEKQWHQAAAFRWAVAGTAITLFSSFLLVASLRAAIRRRTEALDRSLGLLTASYDAIHEGLCVIDRDGTVRNTNPRFRELLGLEESDLTDIERDPLGKQMSECFAEPLEFLGLWSRLGSDSESTEEGDLKLVSGADAELHFYSVPAHTRQNGHHLGRLWVFRDMTEQRHLESSLVQSQKMEAVGRLAGGVAHDFNNLLTGIVGNLSIARLDSSKPIGELDEPLDAAKHAANRAAILIKSLLGFSRQETLESRPSCANAVVQELVTLVRPTFDPKIELESTLEENLSLAGFDPTKLEQVLLNMVVNARDAIGSNGGKIQLTTSGVQIAHPETGAQDRYVCISITDTGSGMADDVRDRVFEPFFTTKDQGKGTGLGLATSYGIIQQMAGWISCESELGEGTTFRIYLSEVEPGTVQEIAEEPDTTRRNYGIAREEIEVLCIDDELVLRRVAEGLLSHSGFQICSAEHGRAALDLLAKRAESGKPLPDIIITDLTMPVMDGKETLQAVRRNYPDLPVVICSGYLVNLDKFAKEAGVRPDGFIQKPYEAGKMIDCIESLMSETLTS